MYEIEKKYLLKPSFHENKIKNLFDTIEQIEQIYCDGYRIRKITSNNKTHYWFNKKIKSKLIDADIEIEQEIRKDIFDDLKLNSKSKLLKYRVKFQLDNTNYDIDQFYYLDNLNNEIFYLKTLEVELPDIETKIYIPEQLKDFIIGRFEYPSNNKISKLNPSDVYQEVIKNIIVE